MNVMMTSVCITEAKSQIVQSISATESRIYERNVIRAIFGENI